METIKNYLESLFKALPKTKEILKLKNELLSNMEEKYHELKTEGKSENEAIGTVIAEFGNIDELLKEMEIELPSNENNLPEITLEEADRYIEIKKQTSFSIGIGVGLCIIGAAILILLSLLGENGVIFNNFSENAKGVIPVCALLLLVAPAVALFIYSGTKLEKYKYIDEGEFFMNHHTLSVLNDRYQTYSSNFRTGIILGVCLCILSPIAIFIGAVISENGAAYGVCVLLLIIAAAVFTLIRFGSQSEAYKKLIRIEEFSPARRKNDKVVGAVAGVVWPLATCVFFIWGFIFGGWAICWIVYPITGVLFGAFASAYSSLKKEAK